MPLCAECLLYYVYKSIQNTATLTALKMAISVEKLIFAQNINCGSNEYQQFMLPQFNYIKVECKVSKLHGNYSIMTWIERPLCAECLLYENKVNMPFGRDFKKLHLLTGVLQNSAARQLVADNFIRSLILL